MTNFQESDHDQVLSQKYDAHTTQLKQEAQLEKEFDKEHQLESSD